MIETERLFQREMNEGDFDDTDDEGEITSVYSIGVLS